MLSYKTGIKNFIIGIDALGQRIDNYLFKLLKYIPKSKVYNLLRKGGIRVNSKRVKHNYKLNINDKVRIAPLWYPKKSENVIHFFNNDFIKLLRQSVVYEDEDLLIINKPSGIAVHSGTKMYYNILDGLRFLYSNNIFLELVHRIDRETSGLLLLAKNRYSLCFLHKQLFNHQIRKKYLALVFGKWPIELKIISMPIVYDKLLKKQNKFKSLYSKIKYTETHFCVKKYFEFSTLIEAILITGRTHQIRLHTSYHGHFIAFDKRYGKCDFDRKLYHTGLRRLFLHASELQFIHPKTKKIMVINSPLDKDLEVCLNVL